VALEISHLKASGRRNWGTLPAVLARLEEAVARGADVRYDCYPFAFGCSTIVTLLPAAVLDSGMDTLCRRLADPSVRAEVRAALARPQSLFAAVGPERIVIAGSVSPELRRHLGQTLAAVAREAGKHPVAALLDLVIADRGRTSIFLYQMDEDDVRRALAHPLGMLGSDGIPVQHGVPHPRLRSAFLQMLCRYVVGEGLCPLPVAVRKMSTLPAQRLRLPTRGALAPGYAADIVVVDLAKVRPAADPFRPEAFRGVDVVVLNGQVVVENCECTGLRAGAFLRR
jgi:N-acyl-D-amino-acid deacylase